MNRWFRFGQPIGSALVTVALLDTIFNVFWFLLQYSNLEGKYFIGHTGHSEFWKYLAWHFLIALRPLLSIWFWIGVIFWGKKCLLGTWLVLAILNDASIFAYLIQEELERSWGITPLETPPNIWGWSLDPLPSLVVSLVIYGVCRVYNLSVAVQGISALHMKYDHSPSRAIADDISDIEVCLEPVGGGARDVWDFYKEVPGIAVLVLLTVEMMWNLEHIGVREMFAYMLTARGKELLSLEIHPEVIDYVFVEDNIMRCIRAFMAFAGIYFVRNERLNHVRFWILLYILGLLSSNIIIALTVVLKSTTWVVFHAICAVGDTIYRLVVLYFSCKFAIVHRRTIIKN